METLVISVSAGTADFASGPNIPRACAALSRAQSSESFSAWINQGTHNSGSAWISPKAHKAFARTLGFALVVALISSGIAGLAAGPIQAKASSIAPRDSAV